MTSMFIFVICILSRFVEHSADIIEFDLCEGASDIYCKVNEVRVAPCNQAKSDTRCILKKGTNISIEFDYMPLFDANKVYCKAFSQSFIGYIPMPGMKLDACIYTHCPIISGRAQTYSNQLYIRRNFPSAPYTVKMWLWDANYNDRNIGCCFKINIRLGG